jgi:hypothetical protein
MGRMTADFAVFTAFVKFLQFWKLLENWNREIKLFLFFSRVSHKTQNQAIESQKYVFRNVLGKVILISLVLGTSTWAR